MLIEIGNKIDFCDKQDHFITNAIKKKAFCHQDIFNPKLQKVLVYIFLIWATLPRVQRRSKVTASLCIFTVSDKCIQSDPEREPGMRKERYSTTSYSCNTFSRVIQPNTVTLHTNTLHCTLVLYMY